MRRLSGLLVLATVVAAACGPTVADRSSEATQTATRANDVLVVGGADGSSVIDSNGRVLADLGQVIGAPGWTTAFAVEIDGAGRTTVRTLDAHTGKITRTTALDGRWAPVTSYMHGANGPTGLSPDGRWLVLTDAKPDRTAFQVLEPAGQSPTAPQRIELPGRFAFDAISDDGESLYLVERIVDTKYRVRVLDVRSQTLLPGAIIDLKQFATTADANGVMNGTYTTAMAGPNGEWYFSVYQHPSMGPYIHALNTHTRVAECILDLPTFGTAGAVERAKQSFWSLALGHQQGLAKLYAVNGALGEVALVDPYAIKVTKTARIKVHAASATPAAFAPRTGAVVSPDGYRLYALGETGIAMIETADLALRATFFQGTSFRGLAVSPDNARLYALVGDGMSVAALDARTGRPIATIPLRVAAESIALQRP